MRLEFEENKVEKAVRIFQVSGITKIRIASYDKDKDKIILTAAYRKYLEDEKEDLKEVAESLKSEYQSWLRENSPLRKLTEDQIKALINDMSAVNVVSILFQDYISRFYYLEELDVYGDLAKELTEVKNTILRFTSKVAKTVGIGRTIEYGDLAEEMFNLLNSRIANKQACEKGS